MNNLKRIILLSAFFVFGGVLRATEDPKVWVLLSDGTMREFSRFIVENSSLKEWRVYLLNAGAESFSPGKQWGEIVGATEAEVMAKLKFAQALERAQLGNRSEVKSFMPYFGPVVMAKGAEKAPESLKPFEASFAQMREPLLQLSRVPAVDLSTNTARILVAQDAFFVAQFLAELHKQDGTNVEPARGKLASLSRTLADIVKDFPRAAQLKDSSALPVVLPPIAIPGGLSQVAGTPPPVVGRLPYGSPVPGKPGFITSPYASKEQLVDVTGLPAGMEIKCPYTGKMFLIPPTQPTQPTPKTTDDDIYKNSEAFMGRLPYGSRVPGKPGFITSPFAAKHQLVDVTGLPAGMEIKCPYTGKLFLIPPQ